MQGDNNISLCLHLHIMRKVGTCQQSKNGGKQEKTPIYEKEINLLQTVQIQDMRKSVNALNTNFKGLKMVNFVFKLSLFSGEASASRCCTTICDNVILCLTADN